MAAAAAAAAAVADGSVAVVGHELGSELVQVLVVAVVDRREYVDWKFVAVEMPVVIDRMSVDKPVEVECSFLNCESFVD